MIITLTMYHADSNQGYIDHDDNDHKRLPIRTDQVPGIQAQSSAPGANNDYKCKFHNYNHFDENANDDDLLQL